MNMPGYHMIRLKESTIQRLKRHGKFRESYDELVNRLLDIIEKTRKV